MKQPYVERERVLPHSPIVIMKKLWLNYILVVGAGCSNPTQRMQESGTALSNFTAI